MPPLLTTAQAGQRLGITDHEVRRKCRLGLLPCTRYGWVWLIEEASLPSPARPASGPTGSRSRSA